jgi:hypothetical protein
MEMVCSYCDSVTTCSCPEDSHLSCDAKFVCDVCIELIEGGVKENELRGNPRRNEIEKRLKLDEEEGKYVSEVTDEMFNDVWANEKITAKSFSKRETAEYFFKMGMFIAFGMAADQMSPDNSEQIEKEEVEVK